MTSCFTTVRTPILEFRSKCLIIAKKLLTLHLFISRKYKTEFYQHLRNTT